METDYENSLQNDDDLPLEKGIDKFKDNRKKYYKLKLLRERLE